MRQLINQINDSAFFGTIQYPVKGDYLVVVTHKGVENEYSFNTFSTAQEFFFGVCEDIIEGLAWDINLVQFFKVENGNLYVVQSPFVYGDNRRTN